MAWQIFTNRNTWLKGLQAGAANYSWGKSAREAKASTDEMGCTHVSNGLVTYAKGPDGKWRTA